MSETDVFLTHDWGEDERGRRNHDRVAIINKALKEKGYETWFDNDRMWGDVPSQMADGIDNTSVVIVFITARYRDKVNGKIANDNCKLEFQHALHTKTNDAVLCVVMEERMRDTTKWGGVLGMYCASRIYIDMSGDLEDVNYLQTQIAMLCEELKNLGVTPGKPRHKVQSATLEKKDPTLKQLTISPTSGNNQPIATESEETSNTSEIDGGGWKLVRHVPAGELWHKATDQLRGTDVYGIPCGARGDKQWSIKFDNVPFNQFLFATGDEKKWLIANKDDVTGSYYANSPRSVCKSSTYSTSHKVDWYRRENNIEDPWISLTDHHEAIKEGNILYGEDRYGGAHAETVLPMHNGANVFIRMQESEIDGGGWTLVRHVPAGGLWHKATDQLRGTDVYGIPCGARGDKQWSIRFDDIPFNQFLFATGDEKKWLIANKDDVTGSFYANSSRSVCKSSIHSTPHKVDWYRRENNIEDPWISLTDHHEAIKEGNILYGENRYGGAHAETVLPMHNGANVFIRMQENEETSNSSKIDGGGWKLVRHVPAGVLWHKATDQLRGTDVYGTPCGARGDKQWSIKFDNVPFNQFLFATGDEKKWLIANKDDVTGSFYANSSRSVCKSSIYSTSHKVDWYRRENNIEDPWISLTDHHDAIKEGNILYGEDRYGGAHAETILPIHNGANVFIRMQESEEISNTSNIDGGGWKLVRHVPAGGIWHQATDQLRGTDVYGTPCGAKGSTQWSIRFDNVRFNQFLFATGDERKWLIANKDDVTETFYANSPRSVCKSSILSSSHKVNWYRRERSKEDPWISLTDHHDAIKEGNILYGEDHYGGPHAETILPIHNGANVFIRMQGKVRVY